MVKILRIQPDRDVPARYNYQVNYGMLDCIPADAVSLERFSANLDNYDVAFLPMHRRWRGHERLLDKIKSHRIKTVMFDNDSCYNRFDTSFYKGIDFIFYRYYDSRGKAPVRGAHLLWSVDTELYTPEYGSGGVSFNCAVNKFYPLRQRIAQYIQPTKFKGAAYIKHLQSCAVGIHTDNPVLPYVRAKILEYAACGTLIISNKTKGMDLYFPESHVFYFETMQELQYLIKTLAGKPPERIREELREIVCNKHSHTVRAAQVLETLNKIL
jgi:hypothetical protein